MFKRSRTSSVIAISAAALNRAALMNTRSVGAGGPFVLGDIGPIDAALDLDPQWACDLVGRSLAGADALLLETWSGVFASSKAQRFLETSANPGGLPVLLSLTYKRGADGSPVLPDYSLDAKTVARLAKITGGIAALGVNCGRDIGMDEVIEVVRRYRQETDLPLFARPNAGTPVRDGDRWVYPHTPEQMAARLPELLEAGVSMVGGCCGTTPAHIAAFRPVVAAWNARLTPPSSTPEG